MNSPQESPALPSRDLFFRLADRLQLQACLQAVEQEGKSVVLHSSSPALLDHYGQILVQRLRQQLPNTPTEIFFPTHTDALLARFNEVLSHVSVDAATQTEGPAGPAKLWIVHDASALPEHELKLLARLLQHLPGARVSAVLMLNGPAQALRDLDPQGRRLLRWHIEPPTPEQITQMVQEARAQGREFAALELVARVAPPPAPAPAPAPPPEPSPAPAARTEAVKASDPKPARSAASPRLWPWAAVLGGAMALSVGVAAWLHPETVAQWAQKFRGQDLATPREIAGPLAPASEPASAASAEAATPALPAASALAPASAAASASASDTATHSAAAPSAAASTPVAAALVTELPEQAQRGLLWLRQQDKDSWVIEHSRHTSVQTARKQIGSGLLANARIVPTYRPNADTAEFAVITGPFRSEDRARNFMSRNELGAPARLHATPALLSMAQPRTPSASASTERPRP